MKTESDALYKLSGSDILQHRKTSLSVKYSLSVFRNKKGRERIKNIDISEIFDLDKQRKVQPAQKLQEKLKKEILKRERMEIKETERFLRKIEQDLKKAN